jgi:hypothetical protein
MSTNDRKPGAKDCPDRCPPGKSGGGGGGPVREAGGTTGAGNLSAGQADRTGGATSGVPSKPQRRLDKFRPPPSA